ncbi:MULTISPECIES: hypothetical protein [unclassified Sphingomonas]|uniref:hypothetical protein n=1 Tax=unclassified Sphingomonas TaxID=196159 RepID=UPI0022B54601|nr:hypothetical protein [Sphingomonas sp. NIBR02145]WHU02785.1 hypothetical protein O3305_21830 [Sphingomonas sp. NIBR02145]
MRAFKLILSLLPLVYIGGLLFYFTGFSGWSEGPLASGLGPTVLGLGAIGLLFCIPLVIRLLKLTITPRGPNPGKGIDLPEEPAFDADAALARYLARKAAGQGSAEIPHAEDAPRPVFGRKIS